MKELKSVGGYIRVSTQEQSQRGLSLESQQADIEDYCRRNGYQLTKLYIDRGITARKNLYKRESFMEMMKDVQEHKINHIVILRLDRWFRNVYDYHRMMHEYLDPNGCGWSAVKEDYDTTTTNGRLMINLRLSIAEQECDQDSDRIKDVFANRIKDGFVVTGQTPMGFTIENKRLVPNDEADIVRFMYDDFLLTNSVKKTLANTNEKFGTDFLYLKAKRTLTNPIYIGKYRENDSYCEPIVDEDIFNMVQERLKKNIRVRNTGNEYIFTGLLRCPRCGFAICGTVMYNAYRTKYLYYRCNNYSINKRCDNIHRIQEQKLEKYLVDNVERLLENYKIEIEAKEKSAPVRKGNRKQIQQKIDRLTDLFVNGMIGMDELKKRKSELESQIIEDEIPHSKDLSSVTAFLNSGFKNIYNDLSIQEKQMLWRSVIKEITIDNGEVESVIFL